MESEKEGERESGEVRKDGEIGSEKGRRKRNDRERGGEERKGHFERKIPSLAELVGDYWGAHRYFFCLK